MVIFGCDGRMALKPQRFEAHSDAILAGCHVTICNNNLVADGNFTMTAANWRITLANDGGSGFGYYPATLGGTLPPTGPQTYVNAALFAATGTQDDTITAVATIPTEVGKKYILNFDLSFTSSGTTPNIEFNPSVGTALNVIYPCGYTMPCTGTACFASDMNYNFYSLSFIASDTTTPLSFGGRNRAPRSATFLTNVAMCASSDSTTT